MELDILLSFRHIYYSYIICTTKMYDERAGKNIEFNFFVLLANTATARWRVREKNFQEFTIRIKNTWLEFSNTNMPRFVCISVEFFAR